LTEPAADPASASASAPSSAPGLFRFSLDGRRAPALFVTGWLASVVGLGLVIVPLVAGSSIVASVLAVAGLAVLPLGLVLLGGSQAVERTAAGLPYPGPSPVLVFAAVIPIVLLLGVAIDLPLRTLGIKLPLALGDLLGAIITAAVFIGAVQLMVVSAGALRWAEMGFAVGRRVAAESLIRGALLAAPVILLTAIVAYVIVPLVGVTPASPLPTTGTTSGLLLHLAAGAIVAPIGEEILFRGFMVTAWARSNGARVAVLRAALLFAVAHVLTVGSDSFQTAASLAFVGAVGRLPVALALGWIYLRSGTIWAPIGLHGAFNAILIIGAEMATGTFGG
jgi:membrane protease YdiL (CAAX protease family)